MNIKQIKADLKAKLGEGYEVIIKEKSTKKIREKTENEIKEIQDRSLSEKVDIYDKAKRIEFMKKLYSEGFSVVALKQVFRFKSHTNIYYYLKK